MVLLARGGAGGMRFLTSSVEKLKDLKIFNLCGESV